MTKNPTGIFLPVEAVFPNLKADFQTFKSLLIGLSRTDTLLWCSRLNLIVSDSVDVDHLTRQQFGLTQFFTSAEIDAVNTLARKHGGAKNVVIFFRGQLLEVIRWASLFCFDHPEDGATFESPEVRRKFIQIALIASEIWARRVFRDRFSLEGGIDIARKRALGAIRKSLEATSLTPSLIKSLGRGWHLANDYFPRYYEHFNEEFQAISKLTVEEYYICLAIVMTNFMNPKIGTGIFRSDFSEKQTPYSNIFRTYMALDSQTADELKNALWEPDAKDIVSDENAPFYNYMSLREKPILRTGNGRAIVLDPVFYSEKSTVGFTFLLTKQQSKSKANEIFGAFGNAVEHYAGDILKRMFPDISGINTKRLSCGIKKIDRAGQDVEIDACLNDVNEVVIFEIKAVWIRENEILADDHETYLQHLRKKYISGQVNSGDRKIKGLGQIARIVNLLADQEWAQQNTEFSKVELVYPILIVYDSLLSAPVYNNFLSTEFNSMLSLDNRLSGTRRLRVAPLTVMTIEDLENLEVSIKGFGFKDLLADYSRSDPDRITSLHNFIALSKYNQKIRANRNLIDKGMEILEKSKKAVFSEHNEA